MEVMRQLFAVMILAVNAAVHGIDTTECVSKRCLSNPSESFGSCEGFKQFVNCIKECPATKDGEDAWDWAASDAHGPWSHLIKSMMDKCGIATTDSQGICLPSKSTDIFEHCWSFNAYQECTKAHGIDSPDNSTCAYLTQQMAKKCEPELNVIRKLPKLKINQAKMARILAQVPKPSEYDACDNFHAFTCEHSLRRSSRPKRSGSVKTEIKPQEFGMSDVLEVEWKLQAEVHRLLEDVASGKPWDGPTWVYKLLHVYIACSNNETAKFCVVGHGKDAKPKLVSNQVLAMLKLYAAELQPGYAEAKQFTLSLLPLIRKEMSQIIHEWAGLGNTTELQNYILYSMPIYIGLPPKFHKYMTAMTSDLDVFPNNTWHTSLSFAAFMKRISGLDLLVYASGRYLVWNAFANMYRSPGAFFGGTLLVPPAFDLDLSYSFLFGDTLFVLFHELTHALEKAFESFEGIKSSFYSYFKRCLIDEYSRHTIYHNGTKKLNGSFTYSENFADVLGFQLTWRMYQKYYKAIDRVPKGRFNKDQVFFVGMSANAGLCTRGTDDVEKAEKYQLEDPHTRGENRLNILLMHSPQFAREFKCAEGTRMNPYKNCVKLMSIENY